MESKVGRVRTRNESFEASLLLKKDGLLFIELVFFFKSRHKVRLFLILIVIRNKKRKGNFWSVEPVL